MNVKVAFLIHLYQPLTQSKDVFEDIYSSCYAPLLKTIKHKTFAKFTLNTPLSTLQQIDLYEHKNWLELLSELYDTGRVELTGSAAYNALLTRVPEKIAEQQIILNEYGLGYYLGRHTGFEGEPSIMLKNISGLFLPEMAVNYPVLEILDNLGYKWTVADESSVDKGFGIYGIDGLSTMLVVRDTRLSNAISLKKDSSIEDILNLIESGGSKLVVLRAEEFGFHNKEGILLLENILDHISSKGGEVVTVSELLQSTMTAGQLNADSIKESSWASTVQDVKEGRPYPLWDISENTIHQELWQKFRKACGILLETDDSRVYGEEMATTPIWKDAPDEVLGKLVKLHQSLNSDQFYWSSGHVLSNGVRLDNPGIINRSRKIYEDLGIL